MPTSASRFIQASAFSASMLLHRVSSWITLVLPLRKRGAQRLLTFASTATRSNCAPWRVSTWPVNCVTRSPTARSASASSAATICAPGESWPGLATCAGSIGCAARSALQSSCAWRRAPGSPCRFRAPCSNRSAPPSRELSPQWETDARVSFGALRDHVFHEDFLTDLEAVLREGRVPRRAARAAHLGESLHRAAIRRRFVRCARRACSSSSTKSGETWDRSPRSPARRCGACSSIDPDHRHPLG